MSWGRSLSSVCVCAWNSTVPDKNRTLPRASGAGSATVCRLRTPKAFRLEVRPPLEIGDLAGPQVENRWAVVTDPWDDGRGPGPQVCNWLRITGRSAFARSEEWCPHTSGRAPQDAARIWLASVASLSAGCVCVRLSLPATPARVAWGASLSRLPAALPAGEPTSLQPLAAPLRAKGRGLGFRVGT